MARVDKFWGVCLECYQRVTAVTVEQRPDWITDAFFFGKRTLVTVAPCGHTMGVRLKQEDRSTWEDVYSTDYLAGWSYVPVVGPMPGLCQRCGVNDSKQPIGQVMFCCYLHHWLICIGCAAEMLKKWGIQAFCPTMLTVKPCSDQTVPAVAALVKNP